jgi:hypothetical protein
VLFELYSTLIRFSNNFPMGIASPKQIERIWKLSIVVTQVAIRTLVELGLLFVNVLPSSSDIVMQAVLPAGLPKSDASQSFMFPKLQFRFEFLDQGLFDKLMASFYLQRDLKIVNAWRTGMVFQLPDDDALNKV